MLKNYFKITIRNLWKRKAQTMINVLGLSLGLASAIVIFLIVRYELSFDQFHEKADRIYRIVSDFKSPDGEMGNAAVPRPLPDALRQDFAEDMEWVVPIEAYDDHKRVRVEDKNLFLDEMIAYTGPGYLQLFDFPLQEGNPATVLSLPNEVVISQSLSEKLFGRSSDVLGEVIHLNDIHELKVSGVFADLPEHTDFDYEMLISFNTVSRDREVDQAWGKVNGAFQTYALLDPHVSPEAVQQQLTHYLSKYLPDNQSFLRLQPLSSIHFEEKYWGFPYRKVAREKIAGLSLLAILLVLLACINFINLATAVSTRRSKEIGVRKVVGSTRRQIMLYFLGEAFLITILATSLALGLAELGLIQLQKLYDYLGEVQLVLDIPLLVFLIVLIFGVTLMAGAYPALLMSRFRPVQMFKTTPTIRHSHRPSVRQGLVVFQFFVAQLFIISVLVVGHQLKYLLEAPLGFDHEAIVTVDFPDRDPLKQQRFKQSLQDHTGVASLSLSMYTAISQGMSSTNFGYDGKDREESDEYTYYQFADADYFTTHQMRFLAGEAYALSDSGSGFVANEAFVKKVGATSLEEVIGKFVALENLELPIVGVVADYHSNNFEREIPPLLISNYSPEYQYLNLKINMAQADAVVAQLETLWQESYADFPFKYNFLDESVAEFYAEYQRLLSLTWLFSGIAITIGCLGLYGLVLFMAEQRTKEIGIRKVLGASVQQLLALFSTEFIKLVLIAFVLAAPLSYFLMQQWLQSFAYRIDIGFTIFAGCLLLTLLLVILTVGYRSLQAALANPVDSLRNE